MLTSHFTLNVTPSAAPIGFYFIHGTANKGDLVLLRNPMKRLVAGPGDTVVWGPFGVSVNGKQLQNSAVPAGSPYPPYRYQRTVLAEGQYLMMGDNPLSWDGRYIGPEPESLIAARVTPLWVR